MLMRLLLAALLSLPVMGTGVAETATAPAIYTPAAGSMERKAILDALHDAIGQQQGDQSSLVVVSMNVTDKWSWLHVRPT